MWELVKPGVPHPPFLKKSNFDLCKNGLVGNWHQKMVFLCINN